MTQPNNTSNPTGEARLILELDASQIKTFLKCPMQWYYEYVERITSKDEAFRRPMNMGTYGHNRLQRYYELRANGVGQNTASHEAVNMMDTPEEQQMMLTNDDKLSVLAGVMAHNTRYRNNDITPLNADSIEVGFSVPFHESDTRQYIICGRTDVVGTLQGLPVIMDHKFQLRKSYIFDREIQFKTYIFAMNRELSSITGPISTFVVNYIRLTKSYDDETLKRQLISFMPDEIENWGTELKLIFDRVAEFLISMSAGQAPSNARNWAMCGDQKYGSGICEFNPLCHAPSEQQKQEKMQLFHIKPVWTPWAAEKGKTNETPIE